MSALGQKRTFECVRAMSALPPKADISSAMSAMSALCQKRTHALQQRLGEISLDIMDVLFACGAWLSSFLPRKLFHCSPAMRSGGRGEYRQAAGVVA
jgi:hypothetical protein